MRLLLIILHVLSGCSVFCQSLPIHISFKPVFGNAAVVFNDSTYSVPGAGRVKFESLKFYVSGFQLFKNGNLVFKEENSFHLLDGYNAASLLIALHPSSEISYDQLKFNLGIDSVTSVSGAMPGALDPSNGMYWTWQSGYINLKLEGSCSACKSRKNEFQLHLGGYQAPFNTLQTVEINIKTSTKIEIELDLEKFISGAELPEQDHVMSPGTKAMRLSARMRECFANGKK